MRYDVLAVAAALLTHVAVTSTIHIKSSKLDRRRHHTNEYDLLETREVETIDWAGQNATTWSEVEGNLTSTVESLNVSSNELGVIAFTHTFQRLQTLLCSNASLTKLNVKSSKLETLVASNNLLSSFNDVVLATTIRALNLSGNALSDWKNFDVPQNLQTLNLSHNSIADVSGSNLSVAVDLVSIDLSSNNLTHVVGMIFPNNLKELDLSNNSIDTFEIREADLPVLSKLTTLKMNYLEQTSCPISSATIKSVGSVQLCVVSDAEFEAVYFKKHTASETNEMILYMSGIVSALISLWFVVLLAGHSIIRYKQTGRNEQQRDTIEISTLTTSRHWSKSMEECFPEDVRFDEEFAKFRADPFDVMQVRTLAHGNFAMTLLVHLGDKEAVMKKVSLHSQSQDRNQMVAFMNEIRVCARLNHPNVVGFLGIMWSSLSDLASIVEYIPHGSLAAYLKEQKMSRKDFHSVFTWMESSDDFPAKILIALQIAEALVYLQSVSPPVIHGHLKGDSILLGLDWNVKLNRIGYVLDTSLLSIDDRLWIAPEVLASGKFDEKSDIFSFGVVLSELDRCKLPCLPETTRQSSDGKPFLTPKFRKDCPSEIMEIAQKCLDDDPTCRPTAIELYHLLQKIQRHDHELVNIEK